MPAILCQHLIGVERKPATRLGWVQAERNPESRQPGDLMAWCAKCDEHYELEGEWNETSEPFAAFRVVCEKCFWDAHSGHQLSAV